MLELYLIGIIGVSVIGLIGKAYKDQIAEFIVRKIEEE